MQSTIAGRTGNAMSFGNSGGIVAGLRLMSSEPRPLLRRADAAGDQLGADRFRACSAIRWRGFVDSLAGRAVTATGFTQFESVRMENGWNC